MLTIVPFLNLSGKGSGVLKISSVFVSFNGSFASKGSLEFVVTLIVGAEFNLTFMAGSFRLDSMKVFGKSGRDIVILGLASGSAFS